MSATVSNPTFEPLHVSPSDQSRDGHMVQLYTDDRFLIDVMSRFIGGALASGDGAVVIATAPHRSELAKQLSARGLDISKAAKEGRYRGLDARETLQQFYFDGRIDEDRFRESVGGLLTQVRSKIPREARMAVFGEMVTLLWAEGKTAEAIRLEQLWNELAAVHSFSLLCAYPITSFNSKAHVEPFLQICREHSTVVPSEAYSALGTEEARLRSIAQLQQRTHVLERELALRESEARFRLLVEAVRDYAIFMLDPLGNVTSWNLGAERIKGYKASEIIGRHFSCFYPEEDVLEGKPQMELVLAAKEGRFEDEGWRLRKDGTRFWANVIITALRNESGKLVGFGKVTRDFTDRMTAERELQNEVRERREAEAKLRESQKSLRRLSSHLLRTQDEERRRIGRDLHDSLGQTLAILKMKLDLLSGLAPEKHDENRQMVEACGQLIQDSIRELRTASYLLYPPMLEERGLISVIPWYLEGFSKRSGILADFEIKGEVTRLPGSSELALFRVLQESLTNVHRHSGAKVAHIRLLSRDGMCVLEVEDEGKGMPAHLLEQSGEDWMGALGVGLRGMNERLTQLGGSLEVHSTEHGTLIVASVPIEEAAAAA